MSVKFYQGQCHLSTNSCPVHESPLCCNIGPMVLKANKDNLFLQVRHQPEKETSQDPRQMRVYIHTV